MNGRVGNSDFSWVALNGGFVRFSASARHTIPVLCANRVPAYFEAELIASKAAYITSLKHTNNTSCNELAPAY